MDEAARSRIYHGDFFSSGIMNLIEACTRPAWTVVPLAQPRECRGRSPDGADDFETPTAPLRPMWERSWAIWRRQQVVEARWFGSQRST